MMKTREDVIEAGGVEIRHLTGSTWNDGGSWNSWVYRMPDDTLRKVRQDTDYRPDVVITTVFKHIETTVVYREKEPLPGSGAFTIPLVWVQVDHIHDAVVLGMMFRIVEHKDGRIRLKVGTTDEGAPMSSVEAAKDTAQEMFDDLLAQMVEVKDDET